jgi:hypothetical protein
MQRGCDWEKGKANTVASVDTFDEKGPHRAARRRTSEDAPTVSVTGRHDRQRFGTVAQS